MENLDFRDQQCKSFNNNLFGGKRYLWEVYLKGNLGKKQGNCCLNVLLNNPFQMMLNVSSIVSRLECNILQHLIEQS